MLSSRAETATALPDVRSRRIAAVAFVLTFSGANAIAAPAAVEISACGMIVQEKAAAFLADDLDCSAWLPQDNQPILQFVENSTFDLRGFTLTAPQNGLPSSDVIECSESCTIIGANGSIVGGRFGVTGQRRVKVVDTQLAGQVRQAVSSASRADIERVTVTGGFAASVTASRRVVIRDSTITGNGGIPDPSTGSVRKLSAAVFSSSIRVAGSTITNNAWAGLEADRVGVRESIVTGNGAFEECGVTRNCKFDVGSDFRPRVRDTACGVSLNSGSCSCDGDSDVTPETSPEFHNWGVCSFD